jgi:2-keto-3-deoxy-L-rhamnonate aldolase RhmA
MKKNLIRERLLQGKPTLSTRLAAVWPGMVEVVGHTGLFDYVEFLAEYAPFTAHDLDNFCRASELYDMSAMVKLDHQSRHQIVQAVAAGFHGVLFANVRSAADVDACVRSVRPETPEDMGEFGAVSGRFTYMNYGGGSEYVQALRDIVVAVMIEKKPAFDELDAILATEGVDMIQWGPSDFSMSVGSYENKWSQDMKAFEQKVFQTCLDAGIAVRAEIGSLDQAKAFLDMGVRHFSIGSDLRILFNWLRENGTALRKELESG